VPASKLLSGVHALNSSAATDDMNSIFFIVILFKFY
jgi:hypothetical protein